MKAGELQRAKQKLCVSDVESVRHVIMTVHNWRTKLTSSKHFATKTANLSPPICKILLVVSLFHKFFSAHSASVEHQILH